MSTAKRVIKNTGFLYAKMGITMFISLYTTRLVLNALGVSDFGIYNVVGGAIAMLGFLNTAMSTATQRFMSFYEGKGNREKQKYIFNVSSVLHFGIALALLVVLVIAGWFFFNGFLNIPGNRIYAAKVIYGSLIISTVFSIMSVPYEAMLNAHENMLYYSIVGVLESFLKLAAALIIVNFAGDKLILFGILMAIIPFLNRVLMQVYCHKKYTECVLAPRKYWDRSLMKEMTGFAGWSFLGSTIAIIANYGQGIVLNVYFGTLVNAAQGIATQINGQVSVFSTNMMKALNPVIVKNEGLNDVNLKFRTIFIGSKISFFLLAIFTIPIMIEMPFILTIWIKNVPPYTAFFCRLIMVISLIEQLFITLPAAISATGNIKMYQVSVSLLLLLPFVVSIVLFNYGFPAYTLYIAFVIQRLIRSFGVVLYFSKKIIGLSQMDYIKNVVVKSLIVVFIAATVGMVGERLLEEGWMRLLVIVCSTFTAFTASALWIGLTDSERVQVYRLVGSVKSKVFK